MTRPTTEQQLAVAWQSASLLLDYPNQQLIDRLDVIENASHGLPTSAGDPIRTTIARVAGRELTDLQAEYVETFDNRRRHSLFLTYFAHGDTRNRPGESAVRRRRLRQTAAQPAWRRLHATSLRTYSSQSSGRCRAR